MPIDRGTFGLCSVPKAAVITMYSIILKLVLFMYCFWKSMYMTCSNFSQPVFLCSHPWCSLQVSVRNVCLSQILHTCSNFSCRVWVETWRWYWLFLIGQLNFALLFVFIPFCLEYYSPRVPSHLLSCIDSRPFHHTCFKSLKWNSVYLWSCNY